MNVRLISKHIATLGVVGYLPAPGTCASLVTLPLVYWFSGHYFYAPAVFLCIFVSYFIVVQAKSCFNAEDPKEIVIDEVVGMLWTGLLTPATGLQLGVLFLLFRFFDIIKPGYRHLEKKYNSLCGACAIIADDILAALLAQLTFVVGSYVVQMLV